MKKEEIIRFIRETSREEISDMRKTFKTKEWHNISREWKKGYISGLKDMSLMLREKLIMKGTK